MANDPNRDILPVKESFDRASSSCDRIEPHLVSRFRRPDLEDKFIKLYEENNDLKRLNTIQDAKIRKLGTKLARYLRDKHETQPFFSARQGDPELEMKVHELEHENYALKDKNTVLKQQLASHSRQHMAAHRSPVIYHPPPMSTRLSQRQASVPNIHEETFSLSNRHSSSELNLRDAEAHINALNEEIKSLHEENKLLRHEIEKTTIVSQKAQDCENIELIKLRQQKKQLEAQLRVADHSQKLLKQDLTRLQSENEDALILIAERQNEIIDLQSKLDDVARVSLELQETKEIVADLTRERDILKDRCEALMSTIREKNVDAALHAELKRRLSDAKSEAAGLRQELELAKIPVIDGISRGSSSKKTSHKYDSFTQTENNHDDESTELGNSQMNSARSLTVSESPYDMQQLAKSRNVEKKLHVEIVATGDGCAPETRNSLPDNIVSQLWPAAASSAFVEENLSVATERLKLQREADCLRELLRAQTQRCELQDTQIIRLEQELKLKDERYKDVFQQRDLFLRLLDKDVTKMNTSGAVDEPDAGPLIDSEDSEECPSQCTYIKRNGTYTKNSPMGQPTSKPPSPIILSTENGVEGQPDKEATEHRQPTIPIPVPRKRSEPVKPKAASIHLTILWLKLDIGCNIMADPTIKALYVDFTILSKSSDNFETPQALPKPANVEDKIVYNYATDILLDEPLLNNLRSLKNTNPQGDCIIFNVVSEPVAEESISEVECPIVGLSVVGFHQFVFAEEDEEVLLPVYEIDKEKKCCGTLAVCFSVPAEIFRNL